MDFKRTNNVTWTVFSLLCLPLLLTACAGANTDGNFGKMSVVADLHSVHRCSRISPEITLEGVPKGTDHFDIRLVEYGEGDRVCGGGIWPNDGTNSIPEGALTKYYRGPCPPVGKSREYAFVVAAMSKGNIQPLEVRLYRFTQE